MIWHSIDMVAINEEFIVSMNNHNRYFGFLQSKLALYGYSNEPKGLLLKPSTLL